MYMYVFQVIDQRRV